MIINYAHRGASSYAPENTLAAFALGAEMKANGIETDIQRSKDGVLVLHHDSSLLRVTGIDKRVSDLTYDELAALDVGSFFDPAFADQRIVRLDDFLKLYGNSGLHLAIELKQPGIEVETLATLDALMPRSHFIITSFLLDSLLLLAALENPPPLGYLSKEYSEALLAQLKSAGIGQFCPGAKDITPERMRRLRELGFSVRAWGVKDEALMDHALAMGVDGMTVNFPDKLAARLA